jgi:primosomal protein N' (replication factor Y)
LNIPVSMLELNPTIHEQRVTYFAEVILPVPLPRLFTYRIPYELNEVIQVGARVVVQFGQRKVYTGLIARIHQKAPSAYQAKYILELLDEYPQVNQVQLEMFEWMASYYMCNIGEVMNAALPSGFKLSSKSRIQLNPDFDLEKISDLPEKEAKLMIELQKYDSITYDDASRMLEIKNIYHLLKSLIARKAIIIFEEVKEKYKPKTIRKVRINPALSTTMDSLEVIFAELEKAPKQLNVLLKYLQQVPAHLNPELNEQGLEKKVLLQNETSLSSLNTLIKNGIMVEFDQMISRFNHNLANNAAEISLTEAQTKARHEILSHFQEKDVALLHGITGSGKTEVYIDLIKQVLEGGSQVLFMLPEIALTTQIVGRLQKVFGSTMGIYHSKFSDNERVEVWKGVVSGQYSFIIGVRSSIFLPFDNLGLIIVDEEHETSYKQQDPAPRYHARDVALMLAHKHKAKVLLGSATPSIETYCQAKTGKWGLVELMQRYGDAQLPEMILVNTKKERQMKTMKNEFSSDLLNGIKQAISRQEQVILFQNRRGYAPYLNCQDCDWTPRCHQCAVSLTYHMYSNELRCHYCGHVEPIVNECAECSSTRIKTMGYGTEKLEEDLKLLIPEIRVQRMDLDTTRKKNSYQTIINEFEERQIDVLVGTQMISKGLDFDHVSLVGIFDADRMLHFPDFRSYERTFQMITQVSGRAGRREKQGKVLIQTNNPKQPILYKIVSGDYQGLYLEEIAEREKYNYPPFSRLICITAKGEDKTKLEKAAAILAKVLERELGSNRVLGPQSPLIEKIRNQFLQEIVLKLEKSKINIKAVKEMLAREIALLETDKAFKEISFVVNVDPV